MEEAPEPEPVKKVESSSIVEDKEESSEDDEVDPQNIEEVDDDEPELVGSKVPTSQIEL